MNIDLAVIFNSAYSATIKQLYLFAVKSVYALAKKDT